MPAMYEIVFEVSGLTDAREEALEDRFDVIVSSHGSTTKIAMLVPGRSAVDAAGSAVATLRRLGMCVIRLIDDLVTRREIADRVNVTTQAVGNWTRGDRNSAVPFPEPYVSAAGATLWLWGEVVDYLRTVGTSIDEGVSYPTRSDLNSIAALLVPADGWHSDATILEVSMVGVGWRPVRRPSAGIHCTRSDWSELFRAHENAAAR